MKKIQVIGGSGSGKSRFARKLAEQKQLAYVELDALFWEENWQPAETDVFQSRVLNALKSNPGGWVVDGTYSGVLGDVLSSRIDTLIYLKIPLFIAVLRVLKRGIWSTLTKELKWGKNHETLWGQIKLAWWVLATHKARAKRVEELQKTRQPYDVIVFTSNKAANKWLHERYEK